MKTLKVGIAGYDQMKARTMAVARGEHKPGRAEPKVWFTSMESFARVLSDRNRALLHLIAQSEPSSRNRTARSVPIAEARRHDDDPDATQLHAGHTLVEAGNYLPATQDKRELTGVERTPVCEEPGVRHGYLIPYRRRIAGSFG